MSSRLLLNEKNAQKVSDVLKIPAEIMKFTCFLFFSLYMVHQASAHSEAKIRTRRRTIIYQCSLKLIFLFSIPSSNNKNSFNDLKAGNAPYCTKHSVCASLFLRKWLAAEKLGWEKEKKHFELKRSNNYYWHNKHLYTYMDVTPQRQERKKKRTCFPNQHHRHLG